MITEEQSVPWTTAEGTILKTNTVSESMYTCAKSSQPFAINTKVTTVSNQRKLFHQGQQNYDLILIYWLLESHQHQLTKDNPFSVPKTIRHWFFPTTTSVKRGLCHLLTLFPELTNKLEIVRITSQLSINQQNQTAT